MSESLPRIKVYLSNGRMRWATVVRLNNSSVWCRIDGSNNLIKRTLKRIPEEYQEVLQEWLNDYQVRLAS
jgi:hypothetical protein